MANGVSRFQSQKKIRLKKKVFLIFANCSGDGERRSRFQSAKKSEFFLVGVGGRLKRTATAPTNGVHVFSRKSDLKFSIWFKNARLVATNGVRDFRRKSNPKVFRKQIFPSDHQRRSHF